MQADYGSDLPANSGTKTETELCSEEIELQCNVLVPIGATKQTKLTLKGFLSHTFHKHLNQITKKKDKIIF